MSKFDDHQLRCEQCQQPFALCRVGRRLIVEDVDALTRVIQKTKSRGTA